MTDKITLFEQCHVVVIDDDVSICNIWRQRLKFYSVYIHHFSSCKKLLQWHINNKDIHNDVIYFIDYELHDRQYDGLQLIQKLNVKKRSYLVTSHAEELSIQQYCEKFDVWLLPKSLISEIPLIYRPSTEKLNN